LEGGRAPVVCLGDLLLDILVQETAGHGSTLAVEPGGSAANTASWLVWCGRPATLIGAVGADTAGELLAIDLRRHGVVPALQVVRGRRSGAFLARLSAGTYQHLVTERGANDLLAWGEEQTALLGGACQLHLSGYVLAHPSSTAAAVAAAQAARVAGLGISVDLGAPHALRSASATLAAVLAALAPDLLFANEEEATTLVELLEGGRSTPVGAPIDTSPVEARLNALLRWAPVAVLKRGALGSGAAGRAWPGRIFAQPSPVVPVVDAVGAGDAFVAGYLAAWLGSAASAGDANRMRDALRRGTDVAGVCLAGEGGRPRRVPGLGD
jgi:sugar/nucleoside kinase (ribokinase family)